MAKAELNLLAHLMGSTEQKDTGTGILISFSARLYFQFFICIYHVHSCNFKGQSFSSCQVKHSDLIFLVQMKRNSK